MLLEDLLEVLLREGENMDLPIQGCPFQKTIRNLTIALIVCGSLCGGALLHGQDWRGAIQTKMESQFTLTKATADKSDIVEAGAVLILQKDDLLLYPPSIRYPIPNTYKDGKISINFLGKLSVARKFVRGEKFWVTRIQVKDDGLYFDFLSDPISDVRYDGSLKFPFQKGAPPPNPDQLAALVAQVLKVDNAAAAKPAASASAEAPAPAEAPPAPAPEPVIAPIPPPPPPPDQPPPPPKEIKLGQTKDQVIAMFGQPTKIANLGAKQILYYPDLKVTLVNGKVTDVQ
jgi:hypothetical protein